MLTWTDFYQHSCCGLTFKIAAKHFPYHSNALVDTAPYMVNPVEPTTTEITVSK